MKILLGNFWYLYKGSIRKLLLIYYINAINTLKRVTKVFVSKIGVQRRRGSYNEEGAGHVRK